jgi:N-acetylmuramoyl-L-alanine amidase
MKYEVIDNLLYLDGSPVEFLQSPNHGREIKPRIIVIHYTGDNSCQGAVSWLTSTQSGVSAHLVIDKDGTIYQLLPFNIAAWHAGKGSYNGEPYVNNFSIGIENVGIGDEWPEEQITVIGEVIKALFAAYPLENVVGHSDVAPGRKADPGPNFPWDKVTS